MTADDKVGAVAYVLSDSVGETAERVVVAAASQFENARVQVRRIPWVSGIDVIHSTVENAKRERAIIVYTLVVPELRKALWDAATEAGIPCVDLMGPTMEAFRTVLDQQPKFRPRLIHKMDDEYFRRIEAVEYAVKYDDGKDPRGLLRADIVIAGVSRTSKTPVSMYLAHRRYVKVANVPLLPEVEPPLELFSIPPDKVVGLTIRPEHLLRIRRERLRAVGLDFDSSYASMERITEELEYAGSIFKRIGCPVIDVTDKAIEETAHLVFEMTRSGGQPS